MLEIIDKNKIKELAEDMLGIPQKHKGRSEEGLDCFGCVLYFYWRLGFDIPDYENYIKEWSIKRQDKILENYDDEYYKYWTEVKEPAYGDTIIFYSSKKKIVNHMGILVNQNQFLHSTRAGTIMTKLSSGNWKKRLESYYRLRHLEQIRIGLKDISEGKTHKIEDLDKYLDLEDL